MWLNKVSESVRAKRLEEVDRLIHEPDPRQRRRNKTAVTQFGDNIAIPVIKEGDLCSGIHDGKTLAALLLHYAPQDCTWNGLYLLHYHWVLILVITSTINEGATAYAWME